MKPTSLSTTAAAGTTIPQPRITPGAPALAGFVSRGIQNHGLTDSYHSDSRASEDQAPESLTTAHPAISKNPENLRNLRFNKHSSDQIKPRITRIAESLSDSFHQEPHHPTKPRPTGDQKNPFIRVIRGFQISSTSKRPSTSSRALRHPLLALTACFSLTTPAFAQSLDVPPPAEPETEAAATPTPEPAAPSADADPDLVATPSRLVGIDHENYISAVLATFEMRGRMRDPFGRHQDPDYVPPEPEKPEPESVPDHQPENTTPFPQVVAAIPITSVIASQNKFLIGGRGFAVGDELRLRDGSGDLITVAVVDVRSNAVVFRHTGTDETAAHTLELLPGGMRRGDAPVEPDGVSPAGKDAPVDISAGGPPGSLSSRR